jgi:Na+-transporting NADH:ubiquinone oxidoreductase subunit A
MTSVTQISKGLDVPLRGQPEQVISPSPAITHVALLGDDYVGMKPTMVVKEGDRVKKGQVLFTDKKAAGVQHTSPAAGRVAAIHRGEKRRFVSLVVELEGDDEVEFSKYPDHNLAQLDRATVVDQLVKSGLWTSLRTRPFSKTPAIDSIPHSLFITAIDTEPLSADPAVVLAAHQGDFVAGVQVLSTLTDGPTYVCRRAGSEIPGEGTSAATYHAFSGPHPSGLPGTHIHFLDPVDAHKTVWHVNYQDVVAIGHLFLTGRLSMDRVISLAGPIVARPRLVRTQIGASLTQLTAGEFEAGEGREARIISGSALSGRKCQAPADYLSRFDHQVTILAEGNQRTLLGWLSPGKEKFSTRRVFASAWTGGDEQRFAMTTTTNGSPRAVVPIGMYEDVMPLDLIATPLLKSLLIGDTTFAQQLGVLELAEEDLALCSFVCPGKHDYGPLLRKNLSVIEQEG